MTRSLNGWQRLIPLSIAISAQFALLTTACLIALRAMQNGQIAAWMPGPLTAWLGICAIPVVVVFPVLGVVAGSRSNRVLLLGTGAASLAFIAWSANNPGATWLSVASLICLHTACVVTGVLCRLPSLAPVRTSTGVFAVSLAATIGVLLVVMPGGNWWIDGPNGPIVLAVVSLLGILLAGHGPSNATSLKGGMVGPFVAGLRDTVRQPRARIALVVATLICFVLLSTLAVGLRLSSPGDSLRENAFRFVLGLLVGLVITGLCRNEFRYTGFAVYGTTVSLIGSLGMIDNGSIWAWWCLGIGLGLSIGPMIHMVIVWASPAHLGTAISMFVGLGAMGGFAVAAIITRAEGAAAARTTFGIAISIACAMAAMICWVKLFRPFLEMTIEALVWPLYRITMTGPGVEHLPVRGPYLVIANHAAWFDPLFLAKHVPTPTVPMMTSKFYDLPVLAWLMRKVIGTIRVPDAGYRREAPELTEAVHALDRGECVVLFPEGYLRRKEEIPLRRFGRGVWQILHDRPQTPVFAVWIEGGWGCFFSFKGGPPTKNKRFDVWRRIQMACRGPIIVPPEELSDHLRTRTYLMNEVSQARTALGLPPITLPNAPEGDDA